MFASPPIQFRSPLLKTGSREKTHFEIDAAVSCALPTGMPAPVPLPRTAMLVCSAVHNRHHWLWERGEGDGAKHRAALCEGWGYFFSLGFIFSSSTADCSTHWWWLVSGRALYIQEPTVPDWLCSPRHPAPGTQQCPSSSTITVSSISHPFNRSSSTSWESLQFFEHHLPRSQCLNLKQWTKILLEKRINPLLFHVWVSQINCFLRASHRSPHSFFQHLFPHSPSNLLPLYECLLSELTNTNFPASQLCLRAKTLYCLWQFNPEIVRHKI